MGPHHCSCIFQHLWYHLPVSPSLPQVVICGRPIDIIIRNGKDELGKGICRFYWLCINPNGDPTCLKTVLQFLPTVKPPRWDLHYASVTLREGGRVLLQYYDDVFPLFPVKMIPYTIQSQRGPRAAGKGEGLLRHALWESDIIYQGWVFHMTDQKPVPVYFRICPVHNSPMCRHEPIVQFHTTILACDPYP